MTENINVFENREKCCNCLHEQGKNVRMNRTDIETVKCPQCGCIKKVHRGVN